MGKMFNKKMIPNKKTAGKHYSKAHVPLFLSHSLP